MEVLLYLLIFLVALGYSFVGHGGASGYLAVLSFFGFATYKMAQSALILNIFVSAIALYSYGRAGYFNFKIFFPFIITSIPFAFVGGMLNISNKFYNLLLSFALIFIALRLFLFQQEKDFNYLTKSPHLIPSLLIGMVIGFLSGMIGIGGGIFLSPILVLMRWADSKTTCGVSAAFILVNSLAGIYGHILRKGVNIQELWPFIFVALSGGLIGSSLGAYYAKPRALRCALGVVLFVAAFKMLRSLL